MAPICVARICAWQSLDGADLSDANLYDVEGLSQAQLDLARLSSGTKLPEGLTGAKDAKG